MEPSDSGPPLGDAETAETPAPRRRRRLLRILLLAPVLLILSVITLLVCLPWILTKERVREEAVSALTSKLGSCVRIARVDYAPFRGVELFGVEVCPPPGFTENVLTAERVAVRYDLSGILGRAITVKEVAVDAPHLVLETRNGQRNLDALLAKLSGPPEPKKPSEPLRGPLSPVTVKLERLSVGPAIVELKGEGPRVRLSRLALSMTAAIDPARAESTLVLQVAPAPSNVTVELPDPAAPIAVALDLALTASVAISADVHDGLALERAKIDTLVRAGVDAARGELRVPKGALDFALGIEARPGEDWAAISQLMLAIDRAGLASASIRADGLAALLEAELGAAAAAALGSQIGIKRGAGEGTLRIGIRELALPLDALAPYAAVFAPGIKIGGRIALSPVELLGTPAEMIGGLPRHLALTLELAGVRFSDASIPARVGALDGKITAARRTEGPSLFQIDGALTAGGIAQAARAIDRADVELHAGVDRLAWPIPGHAKTSFALAAKKIAAAPANVETLKLSAELEGDEVFATDRAGRDPLEAKLGLSIDRANVVGAAPVTANALSASVQVLIDRLLAPAEKPIAAKLQLALGGATVGEGTAARRVQGLRVDADATLADPRGGTPYDANAKLMLAFERAAVPQADLQNGKIELRVKGDQIAPRFLPDAPRLGPPGPLPALAGLGLEVALPKIVLHDPAFGDFDTRLALSTQARADLVAGTAVLESLSLQLADVVKLRASGSARRFLAPDRVLDVKLDVPAIDLHRLIAGLPPELVRGYEGLPTSGTFGMTLSAKGQLPADPAALDLASPPLDADVVLRFDGIDTAMRSKQLAVNGFGGSLRLGVRKGRTEIASRLRVAKIGSTAPEADASNTIEGLVLTSTASLRGEVWALAIDAVQGPKGPRDDSRIAIDVAYPKRGSLDVRRFDVKIPRAGVELHLNGGLARRGFGVLRPELAIGAQIDLDRLRAFYPGAGDGHGKVAVELDVSSKLDTALDVRGRLALDSFSYDQPGLVRVKNATGRIPIDQKIQLPAPVLREERAAAIGKLGDDLEERLYELQDDLMNARAYLDADDILLEPPRAADYQGLRPYVAATGARMTMEELIYGETVLSNVAIEGLWRSGVFRIDRFAAQLWDGDVLADVAVQLTADQNVRARVRATITDLNTDVPYASAQHLPPEKDPARKNQYRISGTADFKFNFKERSVNGTLDIAKLRKPAVERFFHLIDPEGKNANALTALSISEIAGLKPKAAKLSITQNLMSFSLDWDRDVFQIKPAGDYFSSVLAPFSFLADVALVPIHGLGLLLVAPYVVNTVNGVIDKFSVSNILEPIFNQLRFEDTLSWFGGKVIAEEKSSAGQGRL